MAARAGTVASTFIGNDSNVTDYAWIRSNSDGHPHSIGLKRANPYGLHDVLGNVWERCWDALINRYPSALPVTDPVAANSPFSTKRVVRGQWYGVRNPNWVGKSFDRFTKRSPHAGIRIARTLLIKPGAGGSTIPVRGDGGWFTLFDGKSLNGWKISDKQQAKIKVQDGMIVCNGPRAHAFTVKQFMNFHFRAEVKTTPGSIYKTKELFDTPAKDNEWWLHEIIVKGRHVVVKINGTIVVDYTEPKDKQGTAKLSKGSFALQAHDPQSVVYFRNLEVKPLSDTADSPGSADSSQLTTSDIRTSTASENWIDLFNGRNLDGWVGDREIWKVEQSAIVGDWNRSGQGTYLYTQKEYDDFVLKAKFKLEHGNTGIMFRSQPSKNFLLTGYQADMAYEEFEWAGVLFGQGLNGIIARPTPVQTERLKQSIQQNDWNDYEIMANGNHFVLKINGITTVDTIDDARSSGVIGLQLWEGNTRALFKNIRIRKLPGEQAVPTVPAAGAQNVTAVPPGTAGPSSLDRIAAEWVLSHGGKVDVGAGWVSAASALPQGKFDLLRVRLSHHRSVTDSGLANLRGLKKLQWLELQHTPVGNVGLAHLRELTELTWLGIDGTRVTDAGLKHLQQLTKLRRIRMDATQLTDVGLQHLKAIKQMRTLWLNRLEGTTAGMKVVVGFPHLTWLHLLGTQVTDADVARLKGLKELKFINLRETAVTVDGVKALRAALPNCEILHDSAGPRKQSSK